jgi:hypothetical protein
MKMRIAALLLLLPFFSLADAERSARVDVTSLPEGAAVTVDGIDRGFTPLTLFDLAEGPHHVKLRMSGYVENNQTVKIGRGAVQTVHADLTPEKGLLILKSDPDGCNVTINGISYGLTPLLVTDLDVGRVHTVEFSKAGYRSSRAEIRFSGRRPQVREEKLLLDSGVIDVITEPAGVKVTVNGIDRGVSPVTVTGVPKGRATVKLALNGYVGEVRELAVKAGETETLSVSLKALPGTLHLDSVPAGARFYLNGESRGTGPVTIASLKPGSYDVRVELEGYGTVDKTVVLGNGESVREEFRLSNVMGRLEIRTDPPGAQIVFDGKTLGTSANAGDKLYSDVFAVENVLEGEHVLVVRKQGYSEEVRHPKIKNSTTSKVNVRLKRVFIPDIEIHTDRGVYRGIHVATRADSVVVEVSLGIQRTFLGSEIRKRIDLIPELMKDEKTP